MKISDTDIPRTLFIRVCIYIYALKMCNVQEYLKLLCSPHKSSSSVHVHRQKQTEICMLHGYTVTELGI